MFERVLLLCGSLKPPKDSGGSSASRQFLEVVRRGIEDAAMVEVASLDLRDLDLPFYDGRVAEDYDHEQLRDTVHAIKRAEHIVLSVPAYWRSAASGVINLIDLVGGPLYDLPQSDTVLSEQTVHLVVVGAQYSDAVYAASQLHNAFSALGATVAPDDVLVGNIREAEQAQKKEIVRRLYNVGKTIGSVYAAAPQGKGA